MFAFNTLAPTPPPHAHVNPFTAPLDHVTGNLQHVHDTLARTNIYDKHKGDLPYELDTLNFMSLYLDMDQTARLLDGSSNSETIKQARDKRDSDDIKSVRIKKEGSDETEPAVMHKSLDTVPLLSQTALLNLGANPAFFPPNHDGPLSTTFETIRVPDDGKEHSVVTRFRSINVNQMALKHDVLRMETILWTLLTPAFDLSLLTTSDPFYAIRVFQRLYVIFVNRVFTDQDDIHDRLLRLCVASPHTTPALKTRPRTTRSYESMALYANVLGRVSPFLGRVSPQLKSFCVPDF